MALTQLVNQPYKYIDGLQLTNDATSPDTIVNVAAGQARDSENVMDLVLAASVDVDISINGLNGLDTGSAANNTLYYVYIIGDESGYSPTGCILSTSATGPLMPTGTTPGSYSSYRMIGCMRTDGSADLLLGKWFGNHCERTFMYDTGLSVLSAGASATLAAVSLANAVPAFASTSVIMSVSFTAATAADDVNLVPFDSSGAAGVQVSGVVAAKAQIAQAEVMCALDSGVPKIKYINSAASCATTLLVSGFKMSL